MNAPARGSQILIDVPGIAAHGAPETPSHHRGLSPRGVLAMTTMTTMSPVSGAAERRQYRLIFGVAFLVFLTITLVARLLPRRLRPWSPEGGRRMSFIAEARAVTNTVLPFAFL